MTDFVNALKSNDSDAIGTTMNELDTLSNHLVRRLLISVCAKT